MKSRLLNVDEAADRLRISRRSCYSLIHDGRLPATRVGGLLRVEPDEIDRFIRRNRVAVRQRQEQQRASVAPKIRSKVTRYPGADRYTH